MPSSHGGQSCESSSCGGPVCESSFHSGSGCMWLSSRSSSVQAWLSSREGTGSCGCCCVGVLYIISQGLEAHVVIILWGSALSLLHGGSALTFLSWCRALWPHRHHAGALWNPHVTTTTKALCLCHHCHVGVQGLSRCRAVRTCIPIIGGGSGTTSLSLRTGSVAMSFPRGGPVHAWLLCSVSGRM